MRRTTIAAVLASIVFFAAAPVTRASAQAVTWGHARIVSAGGHARFEVDGRPFFLYGAAFFYERLPRERWEPSMAELAAMHINTLDLYVPWNWHELSDGDFDFSGRTSPRRDFDEVLRLAKQFDFKIVLRPGPVVRNEWRNGGYPAWLLARPEYDMPVHDILEGRYPSTATLQNQHSDDAAAEWMRNATHVKYAGRWLARVLRECAPYADRILAVALDDDQGAYIDNQTYPAPHFQAYLNWLRDTVHETTGPSELTFINTYQMKVPASSPVWAMGNWYQSDAYAIGAHDESQLAFSMAELATRPNQPLFASEFQAGWLQGAGEAYPRPADPTNTELAMATMIGTGVRGIVNFPAQDTLNPTGWEAPFANFAYAWDAALQLDGTHAARYGPTADFGSLVSRFGGELATAIPRYDASIAYAGGYVRPGNAGGQTFSQIASATIATQQACRSAGFACNLVDLSAIDDASVKRGALLIVPAYDAATRKTFARDFSTRLVRLTKKRGVRVAYTTDSDDLHAAFRGRLPIVEGADDAVFSENDSYASVGFLSVTNYTSEDRSYASASIRLANGSRVALPAFLVRGHHAIVAPIRRYVDAKHTVRLALISIASGEPIPSQTPAPDSGALALRPGFALPARPAATASDVRSTADVFGEGSDAVVFDDARSTLIVSPNAGARAFIFRAHGGARNWFTTVGGLRDDVAVEPALSTKDRIAKYTHDFPAGTFNRTYAVTAIGANAARFSYHAPDVIPGGATYDRTISLAPAPAVGFDMDENVTLDRVDAAISQRGVSVSSFALDPAATAAARIYAPDSQPVTSGGRVDVDGNGFALADGPDILAVAWHGGDVEHAELLERRDSIVARLTLAEDVRAHVLYRVCAAAESAEACLRSVDANAQRIRPQVAKAATRIP
jgi:hypothetical protein